MEKLKGDIKIEVTKISDKECSCNVDIEGSIGLCMHGLAIALRDIENSLPEEKRAKFRSDFLATVNGMRKEATNVNT